MANWEEKMALIRIHSLHGRSRFWDVSRTIPRRVAGVFIRAQILLEGSWQEMSFNTNWGQAYDPQKEGTWLKQKSSKHFTTTIGNRIIKVRYLMS